MKKTEIGIKAGCRMCLDLTEWFCNMADASEEDEDCGPCPGKFRVLCKSCWDKIDKLLT